MVNSVGVDLVQISEMKRLIEISGDAFLFRTFTEEEIRLSQEASSRDEYFSSRFAAKEATFKAVAPFLKRKTFDLRIVETLDKPDGSPTIKMNDNIKLLLEEAGITALHVSLSHDGDYAIAFVLAEKINNNNLQAGLCDTIL